MASTGSSGIGLARFASIIGGIIVTLVSIGLIYWGFVIINRKNPWSGTASATVTEGSSCTSTYGNLYNCNLNVSYNVQGQTYNNQIIAVTQLNYRPGDTLTISYDPNNPQNSRIYQNPPTKWPGWILVLLGILMLIIIWLIIWFIYWLTNPKRLASIYQGVSKGIVRASENIRETANK